MTEIARDQIGLIKRHGDPVITDLTEQRLLMLGNSTSNPAIAPASMAPSADSRPIPQPFHRWTKAKVCRFRSNLQRVMPRRLRSLFDVQYSEALQEQSVQISRGNMRTNLENTA